MTPVPILEEIDRAKWVQAQREARRAPHGQRRPARKRLEDFTHDLLRNGLKREMGKKKRRVG